MSIEISSHIAPNPSNFAMASFVADNTAGSIPSPIISLIIPIFLPSMPDSMPER